MYYIYIMNVYFHCMYSQCILDNTRVRLYRSFFYIKYIQINMHTVLYTTFVRTYLHALVVEWGIECFVVGSLQWRHNGCDSVSNHQPRDCLLNHLLRSRSKKTSKLRVTGLCEGNSPETCEFPAQRAGNAKNISIWWHHHGDIYASIGHNELSTYSATAFEQYKIVPTTYAVKCVHWCSQNIKTSWKKPHFPRFLWVFVFAFVCSTHVND